MMINYTVYISLSVLASYPIRMYISYWKTSLLANQCTSKYQGAYKEAGAHGCEGERVRLKMTKHIRMHC